MVCTLLYCYKSLYIHDLNSQTDCRSVCTGPSKDIEAATLAFLIFLLLQRLSFKQNTMMLDGEGRPGVIRVSCYGIPSLGLTKNEWSQPSHVEFKNSSEKF